MAQDLRNSGNGQGEGGMSVTHESILEMEKAAA